jgi:transcriptional regulator with XRE-family HTH domain
MTGAELRKVREAHGMSQSQFARLIQSDSSNLSAMELGNRPVPNSVRQAIFDLYGEKPVQLDLVDWIEERLKAAA